ncbi:putative secreted protein [Rhodopirellula sp. SWK7]|uniref:putative secreted protein n=1 Tax=Rhodopirellula sp. SWK7 TaxID=595460 RepID=UPI0002BD8082|nr:putative secreted protein [Rhodopirellula sp. SWK7]EMI43375.1 putative secreted protein [Rhodopirellula sp. SWK7]
MCPSSIRHLAIRSFLSSVAAFVFSISCSYADIVLLGENPPNKNVNDGNFDLVPGWQTHSSPYWTVNSELTKGNHIAGVALGEFRSAGNEITVVDSRKLDNVPTYSKPIVGDVLEYRFTAHAQYKSPAFVSFSLVFGDHVRILADDVPVNGGAAPADVYSGHYKVTADDAGQGMPLVRIGLRTTAPISISLDDVNLRVLDRASAGPPALNATADESGITLTWTPRGNCADAGYRVYRRSSDATKFTLLGSANKTNRFLDESIVNGIQYSYIVTRVLDGVESSASPLATAKRLDSQPPPAPRLFDAVSLDAEIELAWECDVEDVASFTVYRKTSDELDSIALAKGVTKNAFTDITAVKDKRNTYFVRAIDHSGNESERSNTVSGRVRAVRGASFSDLILPMPVHTELRSDLWGAEEVLPRDPNNGIEDPQWSYWGGRPVRDDDGKYHMLVVRWPENALRGHWEWVNSTVVHTVADEPTGPYRPTGETAYAYQDGHGHNADVVRLNDGTYLLYSLINWEPTLLSSKSMRGPWEVVGEMSVEYDAEALGDNREYQVQRNLSGVQLDDGSMLFVSKFGRMIHSTNGLLGPYQVLTDVVQNNKTIPERYRHSNYEDPVMWRDEVQFHQIINAFLDYRAIYLRSADGIHWKCDPGLAYTPDCTTYEDGTRTRWHKLERPHVLQDEFGRATHLSLAVIDTVKRQDYANDKHSSKNLIIPLVVHKRLSVQNDSPISSQTAEIRILVHSEEGFDAQTDMNFGSLRYGAAEEVDFGRGSLVVTTEKHDQGLVLVFEGKSTGLTEQNFAGKLIGESRGGELVVGFSKLSR